MERERIDRIRAFNRFYTSRIGLLDRVNTNGLGLTEARLFFEIGSRKKPRASELVDTFGLNEGYISRVIKVLEKRDLIGRNPSPRDARVNELSLTKAGQKVYSQLVQTAETAVQEMIANLPDAAVDQLLAAMNTVEGILSWPDVAEPRLRELDSGDVGWIIKRHGELYARHEGFDITFEALVARIVSDFIENGCPPKDNGWIAETDGLRLGCVFVVAEDEVTARLRLMLVEPIARGRGVGQSLIDTAIEHSRRNGFGRMVLWTQQGFEAACRLYERNGFRLTNSTSEKNFGRDVVNQSWELRL